MHHLFLYGITGEPQHNIAVWNQTHKAAIEYLIKYQEKLKEYKRLTSRK